MSHHELSVLQNKSESNYKPMTDANFLTTALKAMESNCDVQEFSHGGGQKVAMRSVQELDLRLRGKTKEEVKRLQQSQREAEEKLQETLDHFTTSGVTSADVAGLQSRLTAGVDDLADGDRHA